MPTDTKPAAETLTAQRVGRRTYFVGMLRCPLHYFNRLRWDDERGAYWTGSPVLAARLATVAGARWID